MCQLSANYAVGYHDEVGSGAWCSIPPWDGQRVKHVMPTCILALRFAYNTVLLKFANYSIT